VKKLLLALAILVLALALVGSRWDHWLMSALAPRGPFDPRSTPQAPDYVDPDDWTALADRDDAADRVPPGLQSVDPAAAPADVFYVHPTTYIGSAWNGPVDDPTLNATTDEIATLLQATAFNACCAVYGPRYRQANGDAFGRPSPDGEAALDVAYSDLREVFRYFLEWKGRGRPFVLAGHSQGSALASRLLREEIADTELRSRLVAAYLIGGPVNDPPSPAVPACDAPDQTSCAVGWNARGPRYPGSRFDFRLEGERLCVNPLTWRHDEAPGDAALNLGAVFLGASEGTPLPAFADARCHGGMLLVTHVGRPPRDPMSRVLDWVMGPENYHPIDVQLYWMNLRRNASERVGAYLAAHAAAPSVPETAARRAARVDGGNP
jgi:hypothetical protein